MYSAWDYLVTGFVFGIGLFAFLTVPLILGSTEW